MGGMFSGEGVGPGRGRPKGSTGSKWRKTAEIAQKAAEQGVTPIEVLLASMRRLYEEWQTAANEIDRMDVVPKAMQKDAQDLLLACCVVAKDAAPYIHPRLNAVSLEQSSDSPFKLTLFTTAELKRLINGKNEGIEDVATRCKTEASER